MGPTLTWGGFWPSVKTKTNSYHRVDAGLASRGQPCHGLSPNQRALFRWWCKPWTQSIRALTMGWTRPDLLPWVDSSLGSGRPPYHCVGRGLVTSSYYGVDPGLGSGRPPYHCVERALVTSSYYGVDPGLGSGGPPYHCVERGLVTSSYYGVDPGLGSGGPLYHCVERSCDQLLPWGQPLPWVPPPPELLPLGEPRPWIWGAMYHCVERSCDQLLPWGGPRPWIWGATIPLCGEVL